MTQQLEKKEASKLELWGGVECTVNRVGDTYFDQLKKSGHETRLSDFERFAQLSIRTLRVPIIWERLAPDHPDEISWDWADRTLGKIRDLGLRPIVGFLHHGSGPRYTSLLDPEMPEKLACFAERFAERYPWVDMYTPVNEPLTTARFSGLYGLWYPHERDELSFFTALLNQCRAIALVMRSVRKIKESAQLVQAEDFGKIYSTPLLRYQAEFENERRWLTYDLLCGRVTPDHKLWSHALSAGLRERDLLRFAEEAVSPDIVGINHYITSNRFLDERLERYPVHLHGTNGRHRYADTEAVRVRAEDPDELVGMMKDVWDRYKIPLAVTEVHIGSTRDDQLRWLAEVWEAAQIAKKEGVNIRAVTVWSLLGSYNWNSLVTRDDNYYEPGAFDLRSDSPRPTALAQMAGSLASGNDYDHPVLDEKGWWHRHERWLYPPVNCNKDGANPLFSARANRKKRSILITGGRGTLAYAFARLCDARGLSYKLLSRRDLDIADERQVRAVLDQVQPWAVVNAAGYVRVDDAEADQERCFRENTVGARTLAQCCAEFGCRFVTFSSDLVFNGEESSPYLETSAPAPLNIYGKSKMQAEQNVLQAHPLSLVIRTSAFFGPWDEYNWITCALRRIQSGQEVRAAADLTVSPTYIPDLVHASLDLLIDGEKGIWHLANKGAASWFDFTQAAARIRGTHAEKVLSVNASDLGLRALRPSFSALGSERGFFLPHYEQALERYVGECIVAL
jgi:dTDP-4-dehydrorhamnose reductase